MSGCFWVLLQKGTLEQERTQGGEDKTRAPCFGRVSALAFHFSSFSVLALLVLPRASTCLYPSERNWRFSVNSVAHLGSRYWAASIFFPLQISVGLEETCFALCIWVITLSFCLSVQWRALCYLFTTFFLYLLRPIRQVLACPWESAVVSWSQCCESFLLW